MNSTERAAIDPRDAVDVRATLAGDLEAFGRLVERYQDVAFRAAWLVVRDEAGAQDVCQEGFLRAHRHLGRFRVGEPFRPWLLRIVTNLAKNDLRSRARRSGLLARLERVRPRTFPAPEHTFEAAEGRAELLDAVAHLAANDQDVIQLRYFLDLNEAEMATVLAVRQGAVKSRLSRARRRLREVIEQHYPELVDAAPVLEERDA